MGTAPCAGSSVTGQPLASERKTPIVNVPCDLDRCTQRQAWPLIQTSSAIPTVAYDGIALWWHTWPAATVTESQPPRLTTPLNECRMRLLTIRAKIMPRYLRALKSSLTNCWWSLVGGVDESVSDGMPLNHQQYE
jgi:hypothetical protein